MSKGPIVRRGLIARLVYISAATLCLAACSVPLAEVADRPQPPSQKIREHRVSAGETLYSIAWRYGLDHRTLAEYNGISPPFTIYPGQVLRLTPGASSARTATDKAPETASKSVDTTPASSPNPTPPSKLTDVDRSKNKTKQPSRNKSNGLPAGRPQWRWPVEGQVIAGFEDNSGLNQGIDIRGKLGEPVGAAADGRVVYAGSGLRGYGNLVIIKHNDTFLSAYAHNRSLGVAEGESVKAGQTIAEMGTSGSDDVKLHFEIRRDGKPVNPKRYLPKR